MNGVNRERNPMTILLPQEPIATACTNQVRTSSIPNFPDGTSIKHQQPTTFSSEIPGPSPGQVTDPGTLLLEGTRATPVKLELTLPITTSSNQRGIAALIESTLLRQLLQSTSRYTHTRRLQGALAAIRFNFSLNLSQLSDVLLVARPTVYSLLDEDNDVKIQTVHQRRILSLAGYADLWWEKAGRPLPKNLLNTELGAGLLNWLSADALNDQMIRVIICALAAQLPTPRRLATIKGAGIVPDRGPLTLNELGDIGCLENVHVEWDLNVPVSVLRLYQPFELEYISYALKEFEGSDHNL